MEELKLLYDNILYNDLTDTEKVNVYKMHINLERKQNLLKKDEHTFKNNKYVVGLKYQNIKHA